MGVQNVLSIAAGVVMVVGFIPYVRSILVGQTKPVKVSWMIWASLDTVTIIGMCIQNSLNGHIFGGLIGACIVALLSLKYGRSGWTLWDKLCIVGAVIGIVVLIFSSPTLGIIISLIVLFIGAIPTFISAWEDPGRESKIGWTIFWLSCVFAVMAIPEFTLDHASQPIAFLFIKSIMVCILFIVPFVRVLFKIKFSAS